MERTRRFWLGAPVLMLSLSACCDCPPVVGTAESDTVLITGSDSVLVVSSDSVSVSGRPSVAVLSATDSTFLVVRRR